MITTEEVQGLLGNGGNVVGEGDTKIGKIGQIFLDDQTSEPEWVTVKTGMFGGAESFVPLQGASVSGDEIRVPFSKDTIKDAPRVDDSEGHLDQDGEAELYRYYGLDYSESGTDATSDSGVVTETTPTRPDTDDYDDSDHATGRAELNENGTSTGTVGRDTSGPTTDNAMTRSEERLNVGTERVSGGKARLRKYVVTENVTRTVPVSHEEVRVEREPITDANRGDAMSGGELTSEEHEIDLAAERVVVDKEVVPVERVRMDTETVTEDQQVDEEVRKEQIEADGDTGRSADSGDTDLNR